MKITEKQLQMLMVLLQDSIKDIRGLFKLDLETRCELLNNILNQQSNEIKEINE